MSDPASSDAPSHVPNPPAAPVPPSAQQHQRRFQLIWLIPIVAALVAGYLAVQAISSRGPTITLTFLSADGLKAGQTKVRHKAVDLGTVESISLSDDLTHVNVKVRMQREATSELTTNARFWVVRPRLTAGNISGLDTLLSGAYIELDPGTPGAEQAEAQRDFTGLNEPPAIRSDEPGQSYILRSGSIAGLTSGSPVLYRDITVGEVLRWELSADGLGFTVYIFVRKPFDRFVHEGTHFWNASGVGVDLGANGVQLRLESLQALVSGAVAFDTPPETRDTKVSQPGAEFRLYHDQQTAASAGYRKRLPFLTRIHGSVRGLAVGAPVEVYGIQVGSVTGVKLVFDPDGKEAHVDVHFEIQPERMLSMNEIDAQSPLAVTQTLVQRGLRIQLHTANYLTSQQILGMDFVDGAAPADATQLPDGTIVVPSLTSGGLDSITASLSGLAQRVSSIPFEQIGKDLQSTMHGLSDIANGPELKQSLQSLQATLNSTQDLVRKFDTGMTPVMKRLPEIAQTLQGTLDRTSKLVGSADQAYGTNSQVKRDAERLLNQLSDTARSVRLLADYLNQHPDALIRGRTGGTQER